MRSTFRLGKIAGIDEKSVHAQRDLRDQLIAQSKLLTDMLQQRHDEPSPGKAAQPQACAEGNADQRAEQQRRARHAQRQPHDLEQAGISRRDQVNGLSQAAQDGPALHWRVMEDWGDDDAPEGGPQAAIEITHTALSQRRWEQWIGRRDTSPPPKG